MTPASRFVRPCRLGFAGFLVAALLAPAVHGADKKPAAPPPSKTAVLTQEQLRDCLAQKEKLAKDSDAAVKAKAAVAAQKAEIDSTGKALEDEAASLDRTSEDAVAAFNAKVIERNGKVDAFRAKAEAYNVDAEKVLAAKEEYEKTCANRRFDDRDLNDLQKKK
jgi:type IV secretory pathway VirB10-like protein